MEKSEHRNITLEIGETVTDGWKTYVYGRDGEWHYIGSGNHADRHISTQELEELVNR